MTPQDMIGSFERLHGLGVTVHDLAGILGGGLGGGRMLHPHAHCRAVKAAGHWRTCTAFDCDRVREDLRHARDGRMQVCPAGILEWVVPLWRGEVLAVVLFAGGRRAMDLPGVVRARRVVPLPEPELPRVDPDTAWDVLEALRQLAARLDQWALGHQAVAAVHSRSAAIRTFIARHHGVGTSLADLGKHLGLSPGRAGREALRLTGHRFTDLLNQARLTTAHDLLTHTDLPVGEVAARSGFEDPSYFFRVFRRRYGVTPRTVRQRGGGP